MVLKSSLNAVGFARLPITRPEAAWDTLSTGQSWDAFPLHLACTFRREEWEACLLPGLSTGHQAGAPPLPSGPAESRRRGRQMLAAGSARGLLAHGSYDLSMSGTAGPCLGPGAPW